MQTIIKRFREDLPRPAEKREELPEHYKNTLHCGHYH